MLFGLLCVVIGLLFFALWNVVDIPYSFRSFPIIRWMRRALGRYGISSIYFFGGILAFLKGYAAMRSEERSQAVQQQQPKNYPGNQQQPPQWPGSNN